MSGDVSIYQEWLHDRGLSETPAADAAGVFLRDIHPDHSTLIVALVSPASAQAEIELLRRLAVAVGKDVSLIGVSTPLDIPWRLVINYYHSLDRLIVLGDDIAKALLSSELAATPLVKFMVTGAAPEVLNLDVGAKRDLWEKIKKLSVS